MTTEKPSAPTKPKLDEGNAPYPFYAIDDLMQRVRQIAAQYGVGGNPIPRKDICVLLGKAEPTLQNFFSSTLQYHLLENVAGKGLIVTDLFQRIEHPVFGEQGKKVALLEAINNVPIYKKLISDYNGKILPNEEGLSNLLKTKEFGVNSNSSIRAAKIFFENGKALDIIDGANRLKYLLPPTPNGNENPIHPIVKSEFETPLKPLNPLPPTFDDNMFELPIDLGGNTAYLKYPRNITTDEIAILKIMLDATLNALAARQKKNTKNENE